MLCTKHMKKIASTLFKTIILPLILITANAQVSAQNGTLYDHDFLKTGASRASGKRVKEIVIFGNRSVPSQAILAKIPFKPNDIFNKQKSAQTIRSIHSLGFFQNIQIVTNEIAPGEISLHVIVTEKPRVSKVTYEGNNAISPEKLDERIGASHIKSIDEYELDTIADLIKKYYAEKNYHHVKISGKLIPAEENTFEAHFIIDEGAHSRVKIVNFKGNKGIAEKTLRTKIFTREDWVLGFFDKAGTYHPDAILQDKYVLENYYQSNGYLAARVVDTEIEEDECGDMSVTFVIEEGDLYTVCKVEAPGNDLLTEQQILSQIPIFCGQLYSKDLIRKTMEHLRQLWGEFGYIYADVQPSIRPNDKEKTVEIGFNTDLGSCINVNRITILGNRKTKDKVIRRELLIDEGQILTTRLMEESKRRVELLGYFDAKDGVTWKIIKLDDETADLDLLVNEIKTGKVYGRMGLGAQQDMSSPTESFSVGAGLNDINFMGSGVQYSFAGSYSKQDKLFNMSLGNNWLFDRPIYGGFDAYLRKTTYEDFKQTVQEPIEILKGGGIRSGFRVERLGFAQVGLGGGYEKISYEHPNIAKPTFADSELQAALQTQIDHTFQPGSVAWFNASIAQDMRNHPVFPTSGYNWVIDTKTGLPHGHGGFSFFKIILDGTWYTPIIQEYGVSLRWHTFFGFITSINNGAIPYRELFHIGGPATVRGFKYGQISPSLIGSSLGGTKAFTTSLELQVPITPDGNMRGFLFYDGGAGWDTPDACQIPSVLLQNNNFDYRHAIGIGISLAQPTPVRVDWAFKLDRKKRRGESLTEVHINMSQSF